MNQFITPVEELNYSNIGSLCIAMICDCILLAEAVNSEGNTWAGPDTTRTV
jgi:hypothetical protein